MELLQSLQVFARLAELGSFTKVAEAMQLGRPFVTRCIQDLEASVGVRLVHRTTRTVKLTVEGERFYERVKDILGDIARTTSMFDPRRSTLQGRLRVDIPSAFAQRSLMESLKAFTETFPDIELVVGVTDRTVDLIAEGVDCVLRLGELPDSSMVARPIGSVVMVTCASPQYLATWGEPRSLSDLARHQGVNFLSGESHRPMPWLFSEDGQDRAFPSRGAITVNESHAYVQCGLAGFGIIQAPGITLDAHLASGDLIEVLPFARPSLRRVSVLYPSRTHLAPQVHAFADWLAEHIPPMHPAWFKAS
ncbi:LysR family transcriptional regulator [Pigmentiphaga litoralis]|uniref:LysR family transcriptional regulator for bpeEF and oprC n=1 Tax=Pigmentiphaga litoralis TaxID=516702 RepID=A0A7Y9ITI7_9BURK|nr:LysR family transcriptional regulator [Pigmentiphaga litoralis]NYE23640.1 LysR family transcriptional regulator for bpeEF and oprC [Pigmentiphaga litoralis]NYE82746.1 LysR family transcriptional regulator for bpeEF and oprC [Pigmentiphaga litoralis]